MYSNLNLNSKEKEEENKECEISKDLDNSKDCEKVECLKREIVKDSELSKLLKEPIKKMVGKIKRNENGVIYVEFVEVIETKENYNKDESHKSADDDCFQNIKTLDNCVELDSIDIKDCLLLNKQLKLN
jgi:hypothetical protein